MQILKYIGVGILGVVVGLLLSGFVQKESYVGSVYNQVTSYFPSLVVGNDTATSSTNLGKACIRLVNNAGTATYWFALPSGNLGTSSTSCN